MSEIYFDNNVIMNNNYPIFKYDSFPNDYFLYYPFRYDYTVEKLPSIATNYNNFIVTKSATNKQYALDYMAGDKINNNSVLYIDDVWGGKSGATYLVNLYGNGSGNTIWTISSSASTQFDVSFGVWIKNFPNSLLFKVGISEGNGIGPVISRTATNANHFYFLDFYGSIGSASLSDSGLGWHHFYYSRHTYISGGTPKILRECYIDNILAGSSVINQVEFGYPWNCYTYLYLNNWDVGFSDYIIYRRFLSNEERISLYNNGYIQN